jgi:hypothetical protein
LDDHGHIQNFEKFKNPDIYTQSKITNIDSNNQNSFHKDITANEEEMLNNKNKTNYLNEIGRSNWDNPREARLGLAFDKDNPVKRAWIDNPAFEGPPIGLCVCDPNKKLSGIIPGPNRTRPVSIIQGLQYNNTGVYPTWTWWHK